MIFWSKCDKFGYAWIKKRKLAMGNECDVATLIFENIEVCAAATMSYHVEFKPCWTGDQNGGCETRSTCISDCRSSIPVVHDLPKAFPTFSGFSNTVGLVWILSDFGVAGKWKMAVITMRKIITACVHDSNTIPKAFLTFSGSNNTVGPRVRTSSHSLSLMIKPIYLRT